MANKKLCMFYIFGHFRGFDGAFMINIEATPGLETASSAESESVAESLGREHLWHLSGRGEKGGGNC